MKEETKPTPKAEDLAEPTVSETIELVEEDTERIAGGLKSKLSD
jgi:hypothetical protein